MECIFCKIISKEIPAVIVYEDDQVIAFLDIAPIAKGHCLIVPKKHIPNLLEADEKILEELLKKTKLIAKKLLKACQKNGFNLLLNNGKTAGQLINHLHFHLIPRSEADAVSLDWKSKYEYKVGEKETIEREMKG